VDGVVEMLREKSLCYQEGWLEESGLNFQCIWFGFRSDFFKEYFRVDRYLMHAVLQE